MSNQTYNNRNDMDPVRERELAMALQAFTDPASPEYDPAFEAEIRKISPDWFGDDAPVSDA